MKKIKLEIEETLRYDRSMIIEVPESISEDELDTILDRAERAFGSQDVSNILSRAGIKVLNEPDSDPSSPKTVELEITDITEMDDEEDAE